MRWRILILALTACQEWPSEPRCTASSLLDERACDGTNEAVAALGGLFFQAGFVDPAPFVRVRWHPGLCVEVLGPKETRWSGVDHYCVYGVTDHCRIDVAYGWGLGAVLSHEVFHCALERTTGDPDRAHEHLMWTWAEQAGSEMLGSMFPDGASRTMIESTARR